MSERPAAENEQLGRQDALAPSDETVVEVAVVGAGAAGLVAAATAAGRRRATLLLEKNRRPGIKILMSGGTRCNITQDTDNRGIVAAFGAQGRFLHSALAALSVRDTIAMFEDSGVATKVEPTGKIFPASDRAADVLAALVGGLERSGAALALVEGVCDVEREAEGFRLRTTRRAIRAQSLILTTGGQSYPGCGTTGDGYAWARRLGHTIVEPRPALVPVTTGAAWVAELRGITVSDVGVRVIEDAPDGPNAAKGPRVLAERRGSFLFTHFGLSGPVVLDVSRAISGHPRPQSLVLECDFLPATPATALDELLRAGAAAAGKRQLVTLLPELLPRRLCEALLAAAEIASDHKGAEVGKQIRARVIDALKRARIAISGTRGFKKAEVTAGGVALDEVDSRTMQSKRIRGLFLAGEILDLDGPIGGYNFQAAWSTGYLAGRNA